MGRGDDALIRAQKAIEEYDYEGAVEAFAEAYQMGRREAAFLVTYAGFLLDEFGDYARAHALLKGEPKVVAKSAPLQRLAVRAACLAGDAEGGLAAAGAYPDAIADDVPTMLAYARLLAPGGAMAEAKRVLQKIVQKEPGHHEARTLLAEIDARLAARVTDRLAAVEPLIERGDLQGAHTLLAEALALDPDAREAHRLRRRMQEALVARRLSEARERMGEAEASGDLDAALRLAEEARGLAPHDADLASAEARLRALALRARLAAQAARARAQAAGGEVEAAVRTWHELMRVPDGAAFAAEPPNDPLAAWVLEVRGCDASRLDAAPGVSALASLVRLEQQGSLDALDVDDLRRWMGQLGPLPRLEACLNAAEARRAAALTARLDGARAEAEALHEAGQVGDALALLRTLGAHGGADARVREIEARLSEAERLAALASDVRRAVAADDAFSARRALRVAERAGLDDDLLAALRAEVAGVAERHLGVLPAIPVLDEPFERFPLAPGNYARLGDRHLVVLHQGALLVWNTDDQRDDGVWDLPPTLLDPGARYRVLERSAEGVLLLEQGARVVYRVDVAPGRMPVLADRCPLERVLPADPADFRISTVASSDGRSLVALVTSTRPGHKPRLSVVDLDEHRTTTEAELPFPAFRLLPVRNRPGDYGVSRLLTNPPGPVPRWDFAVVNERGRVGASARFEELGGLVYGVRRLWWEPRVSKYYYTFDCYDPFSGRVLDESIGVGIAKGDLSPWFFEARMEDKIGPRRVVVGDATPLSGVERLAVPWRDDQRNVGLAVFPWLDPSRPVDVPLGPGDLVLDLLPIGDGRRGSALVYDRESRRGRCLPYHLPLS